MEHLVILKQKYFEMVLSGEKTIESRWSMNKCAPYEKVGVGDTIWLKETGKDVTVCATAGRVEFFELTPEIVDQIRIEHGKEIGTDKFEDWQGTLHKKYCSLIWLEDVKRVDPIKVKRSNGAGWIVLKD